MISSAVIIPEEQRSTPHPPSPPLSLKRRQSSVSEETHKRPRFSTQPSFEGGTTDPNGISSNLDAAPSSPNEKRKPSLTGAGAAEERKRGQRLFGALLGTLSQKSSKPAHRKRDEIEQRQRERLRKDNEEREEERRRKREELDSTRRVEQKSWDEESVRIKHRNMTAMANFLQTKTEPKLYYRPWDLRPQEEERIDKQVKETRTLVNRELEQMGIGGARDAADDTDFDGQLETSTRRQIADKDGQDTSSLRDVSTTADGDTSTRHEPTESSEHETHSGDTPKSKPEQGKDDDRGGEELVEGQEDDVMY